MAGNLLRPMLTQDDIKNALKAVKYPGYSRDIVSFGLVNEISIANGAVGVSMQLTSPNPDAARQIKAEAERALKNLPGVTAFKSRCCNRLQAEPRREIHLPTRAKFRA